MCLLPWKKKMADRNRRCNWSPFKSEIEKGRERERESVAKNELKTYVKSSDGRSFFFRRVSHIALVFLMGKCTGVQSVSIICEMILRYFFSALFLHRLVGRAVCSFLVCVVLCMCVNVVHISVESFVVFLCKRMKERCAFFCVRRLKKKKYVFMA